VLLFDDRREPLSPLTTGTLSGLVVPTATVSYGGDTWNAIEIRCKGARVTVTSNGQAVLDCDTAAQPELAAALRSGRIRLQTHTGKVDFRNLRLKRLP